MTSRYLRRHVLCLVLFFSTTDEDDGVINGCVMCDPLLEYAWTYFIQRTLFMNRRRVCINITQLRNFNIVYTALK